MTDDDKALVAELRINDKEIYLPVLGKCADRIEQLGREKAVVSDLWEQQKKIALDYLADCNKTADRIEALSAENERLRGIVVNYVDPFDVASEDEAFVENIQLAALGDTK